MESYPGIQNRLHRVCLNKSENLVKSKHVVFDKIPHSLPTDMSQNYKHNYTDDDPGDLISDSKYEKVEHFLSLREVRTPDQHIVQRQEWTDNMINPNDNNPRQTRTNSQMSQEERTVSGEID